MAAPLQPVLWEILREHPEVYIIAYLDDIHILGEPERVREAYDAAVPLLADIGLELNVRKSAGVCEAFQDVVDAGGEPTPGAVVPLQGIRVLGIPVGSETWVADQCFVMASTGGAILPKLARLNDPQVQLLLLRYSIVPILASCTWYGGGVQPHKLMRGALEHDSSIQQCLQKVAGSPYPLGEEAVALSQLPTRCGGVVDEFGYHFLACNRMDMFTYRHDAVQDVLVEMLRKTPLHTAAVEERRKDALYGDATPHRLVPFAVEAFGGLGGVALQLLKT
ncbi:hypothetical protein CYMTET_17310 [Cymbomonas tetramitiformis]|uniref:Reverse transcriptase domain-containing protein n=1 Tax=Cymbomonas tetramitiformis TaxID=36881 RepID=A0AAE0GAS0_9CHLO|nr:hypothetical protein CYMTET_17310 [Cymbomonas tetramitiformis]